MPGQLEGKVALITGGDRNNGCEAALALAKRGADVVITYKERKDDADMTVGDLESEGAKAAALQVDLEGTSQLERLVSEFKEVLSGWDRQDFDILVNNAGILRLGTFDQITEADLDAVYEVNYKSPFLLTQHLLGSLKDGGRIVNLGSGTASIAFAPLVCYGPFKAALQSLTLYLASFLGERQITVNAVAPGGLDDDFNAPLFEMMPEARDFIQSNTAVGRVGTPSDIGNVIAFLCTNEAAFISGAILPIDGGYHL